MAMPRGRLRKVALIASVGLVVLGGAVLWALPEILRRVALDQIPKHTGRAVAIEDIDLNLFTGRLAIKKFRLAERASSEAFVEFQRLDVRLATAALLRSDIRLADVTLVAPAARVVRTGPGQFNFSDLLRPPADKPDSAPSRWTFTVDRLTISRGSVRARDQVVSPPAEWAVQDLGVDVGGVTTRAGGAPGRLAVRAKIDEAVLDVTADPLRLDPLKAGAKIVLDGFEIGRAAPYLAGAPYRPKGGRLALALGVTVDHEGEELTKAALSGTVTVEREALARAGRDDPFLGFARLAVHVKEADALTRTLTVASVALESVDLKARRDARGVIDVLDMFTSKAPPAPAPSAASTAAAAAPPPVQRRLGPVLAGLARGFEQILVERITLGPSTATFVDESVKPTTTLALTKLQATVSDLTWPPKGPANLVFSTALPGGGTFDVKGSVVAQPLDADLAFTVRNAPVRPYQAYIPVPARLSGRYSGDSRNRIALKDGKLLLSSTGNSWAQDVEIRTPGGTRPSIRVERMDLIGIDLDWPKRAAVAKVGFRRPAAEVVRAADGSIDVRSLFTAPEAVGGKPATAPPPPPVTAVSDGSKPKGLLETMQLDFKEVRIEQGLIRFLDRTTKPAFSQDLSRLELTVKNLTNRPGRRAQLMSQSVVGGDSSLDIRGELGPLGGPHFIDLEGELRRFRLASVDPYAETAIGWLIKKGDLQYKVRFKLDGDELAVTNEVVVGQLQVEPASGADEVKQRIGLPLALIVALVKDGKGEIRVNVPVTGSVKDPKFDLRETIWTAVKNVLANIVQAPFRAISRLFSGGDKIEEPKVDAVTFAAGSAVLAPDMEEHLLRVADFLRRSPYVNLALAPAPSAADAEALKAETLTARLREFQKQRSLKDGPGVISAYFTEHLAGVKPPAAVEEQLALLREREPAPEAGLGDLARRRLDATRQRLVAVEGIPAQRLTVVETNAGATAPAPGRAGRVEFTVVAASE